MGAREPEFVASAVTRLELQSRGCGDGGNVNDDGALGGDGDDDKAHHYLHSNADERYHAFFCVLRGVSLGEPMVREDIAMQAIHAGSALTFSPREVERHLQRAVEECSIMRSRGNIYFV